MRARVWALTAGLLVVIGYPVARLVARASDPAPGDLDLSDAWAWAPVAIAGLATSAAVLAYCLYREATRAVRTAGTHESFEYHDAMLQRMVAARMALELDEPDRAGRVLDTVIESASDVITSFAQPGPSGLPRRDPHEVV